MVNCRFCNTCRWWQDYWKNDDKVCCNADSERVGDFTLAYDSCEKWQIKGVTNYELWNVRA